MLFVSEVHVLGNYLCRAGRMISFAIALMFLLLGGVVSAYGPDKPSAYWYTRNKPENGLRMFIDLPLKVRENEHDIHWHGNACYGNYKGEIALRASAFWHQWKGMKGDRLNYRWQWTTNGSWVKAETRLTVSNTLGKFDARLSRGQKLRFRVQRIDGRTTKDWAEVHISHPCENH